MIDKPGYVSFTVHKLNNKKERVGSQKHGMYRCPNSVARRIAEDPKQMKELARMLVKDWDKLEIDGIHAGVMGNT